jgi:hypothetical protein
VRLAYLDKAGTSKTADEPYLLVAGIILHGDDIGVRSSSISGHLSKDSYLMTRSRFSNAKDIFHGRGKFPPGRWPRERRWRVLAELAEIPRKLDFPIIFGRINRDQHKQRVLKAMPRLPNQMFDS